ncbi:MAG: leucine-rich repeat protein [Lachnospiraceae bacterium]|nr:leucine-rich repeat protein [Lachnospiraceae bacterium]
MRGILKRVGCILLALAVWIAGLQIPVMDVKASEDDWQYKKQSIGTFVAYGNGSFVSVADSGRVWISQNGYTWQQKGSIAAESMIGGLDYCGEYFFVYGSMGEVYLSRDGSNWSKVSVGRGCILKIVYGDGKYVANVGRYDIISGSIWEYGGFGLYESDNGINWKFSESTINDGMKDIAYGNGCFVAVGEKGTIYRRGKEGFWEKQSVGEGILEVTTLEGIAYGNGVFVATTKYNGFFTSVDGVDWKQETGCYGRKIVYYNSCFYVWDPSIYYGNCLYVRDCRDSGSGEWIQELDGMQYDELKDIACGNGKVVIVTSKGVVIYEGTESPEFCLSYLSIKQGNLDCEFQPDKTSYKAVVSESLDSIDLSAKAMEEQASITIKEANQMEKKLANGGSISLRLKEEDTVFEITVLAEDKMAAKTYYLTVVRAPQYRVSVKEAVGGYATGAAYVEEGGSAVLTAVPKEGFQFVCWKEEDVEIARDRELLLSEIQKDREILPVFEPVPDQGISFEQKEVSAARGEEVVLRLAKKEEEGYHSYQWRLLNGSNSAIKDLWYEEGKQVQVIIGEREEENILYVQGYDSMDESCICTAVILVIKNPKTYQITVASSDEHGGRVTGGGSMAENENMLLTAKANLGYYFVEWQENGAFYSREESIILSGIREDKSFTAVFERKKLDSLQITRKPSKLSYKAGEQFDTKGMLVEAVYNDGSSKFIADYDYSPKEALTTEDSYVRIVYEDGGVRKEAKVTIKVSGENSENQEQETEKEEGNKTPEDDKEEGSKQPGGNQEESDKQPGDGNQEESDKQPGDGNQEESDKQPDDGNQEESDKQPDDGNQEESDKQPGDESQEESDKQPDDGNQEESDKQPGDGNQEESDKQPGDENPEEADKQPGSENPKGTDNGDKKEAGGQSGDAGKSEAAKQPETVVSSPKIMVGATVQSGNYKYKVVKIEKSGSGQVYLTGSKKALSTVKVPKSIKINGKTFKVMGIGDNAFKNNKKLKNVIIGENVQKIGTKAFYGCRKLTSITINSKKINAIGKKAFLGIYKKAVINVPKKYYKKYVKLLKGKGLKSTMKIKKK